MVKPAQTSPRPDYGIDAPGAVRNLFIVGSVALLVSVLAYSGLFAWTRLTHRVAPTMAVSFLGMGGYLFYSSKVSKLREREQLLDLISRRGDERAGAVREIARVLKPGGACILADIRHEAQYAGVLRESGVTEQRHDFSISSVFFAILSLGNVRPFVLVGRKPSASS